MKIEKLNDRQIRCTLSKEDLNDRQLHLSELAYGSDKAKALFQEMMQKAFVEYGFEAEDIPLMIEAIPLSGESLVLVVTKVEDPEELDTRFSKFTSNVSGDVSDSDIVDDNSSVGISSSDISDLNKDASKDALINCFDKLSDIIEKVSEQTGKSFIPLSAAVAKDHKEKDNIPPDTKNNKSTTKDLPSDTVNFRIFRFTSLESVINTCIIIKPYFKGASILYKMADKPIYLLMVKPGNNDTSYNRVCGILSEYARQERTSFATMNFIDEHFKLIISENAVRTLSKM